MMKAKLLVRSLHMTSLFGFSTGIIENRVVTFDKLLRVVLHGGP